MDLAQRKCAPVKKGSPKLSAERVSELLSQVKGWKASDDKLTKTMAFKDFVAAMAFLGRVAVLAEAEQHHPDFCVHYNRVDFTLSTHDVGGLSENDFILAAKIDALA
ncbi:MAG TPA: 4a-hydroxytetrahydrobiopterin dehydratase [Polyangiaceae bacterium]|jgi:4a-hydroxytetrahydrobiopterin dehydratase